MSDLRTAAQQALQTLEALQGGCTDSGDGTVEAITVWCPEVIDALRAALAAAVAEPVAISVVAVAKVVDREDGPDLNWLLEGGIYELPAGVVLLMSDKPLTDADGHGHVYAAPPQRERELLTDQKIEDLAHREAWTYRHSSDPHHSHTYKFNRACLLEFARKLLAASAPKEQA